MKPYGRYKKVRLNIPDNHPHPKHLIINWWEDMCRYLDRSSIKRLWKKEVEQELNQFEL